MFRRLDQERFCLLNLNHTTFSPFLFRRLNLEDLLYYLVHDEAEQEWRDKTSV